MKFINYNFPLIVQNRVVNQLKLAGLDKKNVILATVKNNENYCSDISTNNRLAIILLVADFENRNVSQSLSTNQMTILAVLNNKISRKYENYSCFLTYISTFGKLLRFPPLNLASSFTDLFS